MRRKRNLDGYMEGGVFHPIRGSEGYDDEKLGSVDFDFGENTKTAQRRRERDERRKEREAKRQREYEARQRQQDIRERKARQRELAHFVRQRGGIRYDGDLDGEIRRLSRKESGSSGLVSIDKGRGLYRRKGRGLKPDYMREAAVEAGLIPDDMSIGDFLEAVEKSARVRNPKRYTVKESFALGYNLGAKTRKAHELTNRQIEERLPSGVDLDAAGQGYLDGRKGDTWRLKQNPGGFEDTRRVTHKLGIPEGSQVAFTIDRNGKPIAYRYSTHGLRWIRVGYDEAKMAVATGKAREVRKNPKGKSARNPFPSAAVEKAWQAWRKAEKAKSPKAQELESKFVKAYMAKKKQTKRKANPAAPDHDAARELYFSIINDRQLYDRRVPSFVANAAKKIKAGTYDHSKAAKLYSHLALEGSKKYSREYSTGRDWASMFSPSTRLETGRLLADHYHEAAKNAATLLKKNPGYRRMVRLSQIAPGSQKAQSTPELFAAAIKRGEAAAKKFWLKQKAKPRAYSGPGGMPGYQFLGVKQSQRTPKKIRGAKNPSKPRKRNFTIKAAGRLKIGNPGVARVKRLYEAKEKARQKYEAAMLSGSTAKRHAAHKVFYDAEKRWLTALDAAKGKWQANERFTPVMRKPAKRIPKKVRGAKRKNPSVPALSDMSAGGTFAAPDKHGYSWRDGSGVEFHIDPISSPHNSNRHLGYSLKAFGLPGESGWRWINRAGHLDANGQANLFSRASSAAVVARQVYKRKKTQNPARRKNVSVKIGGKTRFKASRKGVSIGGRVKLTANPVKKRNGIFEKFHGRKATRVSGLNAPDGTPRTLDKLGKLVSLHAAQGTIKPNGSTVWLCSDQKGRLHLATSGARLIDGPAQNFGEVKKIEYETTKTHLDGKPAIYYHFFGEEGGKRPTLVSDGKGGLRLRGGSYKIRAEGIRD